MNLKLLAKKETKKAYAPYSKVKVGCALIGSNNKIYTGANIENASYGLTICAERVAVFRAVMDSVKYIKEVYIYSDKGYPPCGACLQVLSEFSKKDLKITIGSKKCEKVFSLKNLLPYIFELTEKTRNLC